MNDDPVLYSNSNNYQTTNARKILNEFAWKLNWREDGRDSVLDVGCGSGNVTMELVLPILPSNFHSLIACDLSDKMIEYAQQKYRHPKVEFGKFDITDDVDEFLKKYGPFDHIVSFFCLNWIQNQRQAINNIRKLLASEGDCLLIFATSSNLYTVYDEMSKLKQWSQYMQDAQLYIPAHQYVRNPADDFQQLCQSIGFSCSNIQVRETAHVFKDYDDHKSTFCFSKLIRAIVHVVISLQASRNQ